MSKQLPYWCPACDRQGNKFSQVSRGGPQTIGAGQAAGMMVVCPANHRFPYDRFMALSPRMIKPVFNEKQPIGSQSQSFWIHPEALAGMQRRWPSNLLTTLYSLFNALAHQDSFIVEPEYAVELAKKGITKGREVMGLVTENENLKLQIVALEERVKRGVPRGAAAPLADPRMDAILAALLAKGIEVPNLPSNSLPAGDPAKVIPLRRNIHEGIDLDTGNYVGDELADTASSPDSPDSPDSIEMGEFTEPADDLVEPAPRTSSIGLPRPATPLR